MRRGRERSRGRHAHSSSGATAGRTRPRVSRRRGGTPSTRCSDRLERRRAFAMSRSVYRRERGWRLRWALLVQGDLLAACLAYLLAFLLRAAVPFPLTRGYLPALRFAEVHHHWIAMLAAQAGVLFFLRLFEPRGLINPRAPARPIAAAAGPPDPILIAVYV